MFSKGTNSIAVGSAHGSRHSRVMSPQGTDSIAVGSAHGSRHSRVMSPQGTDSIAVGSAHGSRHSRVMSPQGTDLIAVGRPTETIIKNISRPRRGRTFNCDPYRVDAFASVLFPVAMPPAIESVPCGDAHRHFLCALSVGFTSGYLFPPLHGRRESQ